VSITERLRAMIGNLPPGSALSLPVDWLRAELDAEPAESAGQPQPLADLTVEEVAEALTVAESTVRTWLAEGLFPNARKVRNRWRIPPGDVRARFQAESVPGPSSTSSRPNAAELSDWRKHVPRKEAA
jgi:excisionase family DNA binding protein